MPKNEGTLVGRRQLPSFEYYVSSRRLSPTAWPHFHYQTVYSVEMQDRPCWQSELKPITIDAPRLASLLWSPVNTHHDMQGWMTSCLGAVALAPLTVSHA